LKKLMMFAAMLALVVVVGVVPALAQNNLFNDNNPFNNNNRFNDNNNNNNFGNGFSNNNGDPGISLQNDQETQSGDFSANFSVNNTGDYASQCTPAFQQGNTGNFNNSPSFLQYASNSGNFEPGGIDVTFGGSLTVDCPSTIEQSSAASG
jgi:hypothetical protein